RSEAAAAPSSVEVEIFVVKPDGTPDDEATVALESDEGETNAPKRIGPGVYLAEFVPEMKPGSARLEAKANGQLASLDVPVRAGSAKPPFWRGTAGTQGPWAVSAGMIGGLGGSFGGASAGALLAEVAVRVESYPVELLLDLGGSSFGEVSQYAAVP